MNPEIWGLVGILTGAILVTASSVITTLISTKSSTKNQITLEKLKREELFRDFQRKNFLEIQDILSKIYRYITVLHIEDLKNYKITKEWQKGILNDETNDNLLISNRNLCILSERVQNDNLRNQLKQIRTKMNSVSKTVSPSESNDKMFQLVADFDKIMNYLGVELRKNY